jgi:hypothetical protein
MKPRVPTRKERAVLRARDALKRNESRLLERLQQAQEALGDDCSHPVTFRYQWQTKGSQANFVTGERCVLCDKRRPFAGRGRWKKG